MNKRIRTKLVMTALSTAILFSAASVPAPVFWNAQTAEAASTATIGTIQSSVSFRTAASTSASRIRYLKKGEQVTILSQPNSYWYQVKDSNGTVGYISSKSEYVKVSGSSSSSSSSSSGTGSSSGSGAATQPSSSSVESVIAAGMKYLGTPYEYGSSRSTTTTFDCSDFVRQSFIDGVGLTLPADSRGQGTYVKNKGNAVTDWRQLKRGDLMFFMSYKGTSASSYSGVNKSTATITHDGIYLGDGKILHTYSKESGGVKITSIAGTHWEHRFLYGGSAL
ncbi:C40 family peptidase [Paenibacillus sp. NEAU-GSW1]|uniref:C40 family peptidase n=1 Tax=Paenibacillus sp. NEAU-GSW1 TaxID=2682486 RepID=UPI0012E19697|nr:SH3 domain-containing C40 family peptidase [Paenibacillus sp. NEAU-GSW1]MUT67750.1 SH3 domain-containing protein [Paenibacillus sp. NEAU-GSW1]